MAKKKSPDYYDIKVTEFETIRDLAEKKWEAGAKKIQDGTLIARQLYISPILDDIIYAFAKSHDISLSEAGRDLLWIGIRCYNRDREALGKKGLHEIAKDGTERRSEARRERLIKEIQSDRMKTINLIMNNKKD